MNEQLLERLNTNLEKFLGGGNAAGGAPAITMAETPSAPMAGWAQAAPAPLVPAGQMMAAPGGSAQAGAVLVPVSMQTPEGDCTVYLQFDAAWGASPMALAQLLQQLIYSGVPVKTWRPKSNWGGGGGWDNNRGGGYRGRGGYGGGRGGRW